MTASPLPTSLALLGRSALTLARRGGEAPTDATPMRFDAAPLDASYLSAYRAYVGGVSPVPLTALYPLAQRAQLARMVAPGMPFALPGMIHVANEMTAIAPLDPTRGFALAVTATPAERGRLALVAVFTQGGTPVAECRSLYQPSGPRARGEKPAMAEVPHDAPLAEATWPLAPDEGWRYARLSGDYNPIHLSPWLARPFGFDRPILHGMAIVGRVAALAEAASGRVVTTMEARFRRPMRLPSEVRVVCRALGDDGGYRVETFDGACHVEGAYRFSPR